MLKVGFKSSAGLLRENNEDAYFVMPDCEVYIVADGVGGNNAGELASSVAIEEIADYSRENLIKMCSSDEDIYSYFNDCLQRANRRIYDLSENNEENRGMATTVVMTYINDDVGYFANVGDSRAYIYREGQLHQITEDHTYVNSLVHEGKITKEDAKIHIRRNVITRALGAEATVNPDFFRSELKQGDTILLCTDGLYGEVPEEEIKKIFEMNETMSETAALLVEKAIEFGGKDNITVICLKV